MLSDSIKDWSLQHILQCYLVIKRKKMEEMEKVMIPQALPIHVKDFSYSLTALQY